ncbi:RagB/SusD family nutrient uptake outer membrane protein [Chitinophaga nivalis]|uniref:RagB/SusD family nutrient uptake outer membrane protein n=1 Tax=Chitinophaga nivalis TaxID=2991709 RepID=A0ABT3IR57_9BACT|nr:RagB/SusD family nutrient uptake outer membrane protein [Chitinophaga nivalis]MCW3464106.1 RagB/SusD family nutrient uptake outer membrane protein [Chitinophaga nivalis]MCW3486204.1 RagB/SusD family nutrient uptake outer membrane protein [Chitinophaga nivalis]
MKANGMLLFLLSIVISACQKDWLDAKPISNIVVPTTLSDCQGLLDNLLVNNLDDPSLGEMGSDNYILKDKVIPTVGLVEKNAYLWKVDVFENQPVDDWNIQYTKILYANTALDGVGKIDRIPSNIVEWDNVKGSALFNRAYANFNLSQIFAKVYDHTSSNEDLGIPIRTTVNLNDRVGRGTLEKTYQYIIDDLKTATAMLPLLPVRKIRPSKSACYGMLSRVYLAMQQFDKSLLYADSCIHIFGELLDYNKLDTTPIFPFNVYNDEVIYHRTLMSMLGLTHLSDIDTTLYKSYQQNDLRRNFFFKIRNGRLRFTGSYTQSYVGFGGLALDEVYLNKSECEIRLGDVKKGVESLNTLLRKRWKEGTYKEIKVNDASEALSIVLRERRKELLMRGIRWSDLRRLNKDPRIEKIVLSRFSNGVMYHLLPNDKKYVYPIPTNEILLNNMPQNSRE